MIFFTQMARLATRHAIAPKAIELAELPVALQAYENYFKCELKQGPKTKIVFHHSDAQRPFLTNNQTMLSFFEGELQQKLREATAESSTADKVSSVLLKSLPQGESSIEHVASQLALSKRSLQRKLSAENQNYQQVLQVVREGLAEHYLTRTELPIIEVSFLLGFHESNSFVRAYNAWTGTTPTQTRERAYN